MSAPSLPEQTSAAPSGANPPSLSPAARSETVSGTDAMVGETTARTVHGTLRLPEQGRTFPRWLKWLPIVLVPAGVVAVVLDRQPESTTIRGEIGRVLDPSEVLPVFTEIDDEPIAPGEAPAPGGPTDPTPDVNSPNGGSNTDPTQVEPTDGRDQDLDTVER
ncbi:MAG: hypothetical protein AB8G26_04060 [Ilumatobacter sp.]